jgi:hypothetical protein
MNAQATSLSSGHLKPEAVPITTGGPARDAAFGRRAVCVRGASRVALIVFLAATSHPVLAQRPVFEGLGRREVDSRMTTCIPRDVTNNPFGTFGSEEVVYQVYLVGGVSESAVQLYRKCRWRDYENTFVVQDAQKAANLVISADARYRVGAIEVNPNTGSRDIFLESSSHYRLSQDVPSLSSPGLNFNPNSILLEGLGIGRRPR